MPPTWRPSERAVVASAMRWTFALPLAYLAAGALWLAIGAVSGIRGPEGGELARSYPGRIVGNVVSGLVIPTVAALVVYFDRVHASALAAGSVLVLATLSGMFASGGGTWVDLASAFGPAAWTAYGIRRTELDFRRLS